MVNTEQSQAHSKRHYVVVFFIIFALLMGGLLFFLEKTVGLRTLLDPSAGVQEEVKLKKDSANRVIKNRRYMPISDVITVTLRDEQQRPVFLAVGLTFELAQDSDEGQIKKVLPIIRDSAVTYLRGVRPDELSGTQGIYRIREELLFRVNRIIAPVTINDILFHEFTLQ